MQRLLRELWVALLDSLLVHTLRSSMLTGGVVLLVSSTGAWQYMASSLNAHDTLRSFSHRSSSSPEVAATRVVVVAIDDIGYTRFFNEQSPLNRGRLAHLMETVADSAPKAKRIILDLDVSPGLPVDTGQDGLDRLIRKNPDLWVLPRAPVGDANRAADVLAWQANLCGIGVRFGHPYVPNEFGYPKLTHQFSDGLAQVAVRAHGGCDLQAHAPAARPVPLSPAVLHGGSVVPFSGDLAQLAQMLNLLEPEWVVLGAAWGTTDVFQTPFGDRYGLQVHAAGLAGTLEGARIVPFWVQLLLAWWFVAVVTAAATVIMPRVQARMEPQHADMTGHMFFQRTVLPVLFVVSTVAAFLGFTECLAVLRAKTGVWVPSATIASTVGIYMMVVWVWGRQAARPYSGGTSHVWMTLFLSPVQAEFRSMAHCWQQIWRDQPVLGLQAGTPSRPRLMLELWLAAASAFVQTVLPAWAVVMAFQRPL